MACASTHRCAAGQISPARTTVEALFLEAFEAASRDANPLQVAAESYCAVPDTFSRSRWSHSPGETNYVRREWFAPASLVIALFGKVQPLQAWDSAFSWQILAASGLCGHRAFSAHRRIVSVAEAALCLGLISALWLVKLSPTCH